MLTKVTHLTLFVIDQDAALDFYKKIGFEVHTDADFDGFRWLTMCLPEQKDFEFALIKAETPEEQALVGKQAGEKPLFNLETNDCRNDYERLKGVGVTFIEEPAEQPWGVSAAFNDVSGNVIYMCEER